MSPPNTGNASVATSLQQGPDGRQWVGLHLNGPLFAFAVVLPPDAELIDNLADGLPGMLRDTAKAARQANSGLVIAPSIESITPARGAHNARKR
jgi:hypothetical protein